MFREKRREILYFFIYLMMLQEPVTYCCKSLSAKRELDLSGKDTETPPLAPGPPQQASLKLNGRPSLTCKNFQSILKWETEEQSCDIGLYNSSCPVPLSLPMDCMGGQCIADLTNHLQDIYSMYWTTVQCPSGGPYTSSATSNQIQLYRDVKVGPPQLNMSVFEERLDVSVLLPLAPGVTPGTAPRSPLTIISNLRNVLLTVTMENSKVYINSHNMTSDPQTFSLPISVLPGSRLCVNVTFPKTQIGIGGLKCETVPPKQREPVALRVGLFVLLPLLFAGVLLVLMVRKYQRSHRTHEPAALAFRSDIVPVQLVMEEVNHDKVSLATLELDTGTSYVPCKDYERNGFLQPYQKDHNREEEEEYSTGGSSAYSCGMIPDPISVEIPSLYKQIPEDWNCPPNIDLNSIQVLRDEQDGDGDLLDLPADVGTEPSMQGTSSHGGSVCSSEEEEEEDWTNLHPFTGYESRPRL